MPEWEETAAVACAVQNMHLAFTAEGLAGYWSSGGVMGDCAWANAPETLQLLGMSGECQAGTGLVRESQECSVRLYLLTYLL